MSQENTDFWVIVEATKKRADEFEVAALELGKAIAETCWTCRQWPSRTQLAFEQDYSGRLVENIGPLYEKARRLFAGGALKPSEQLWFPFVEGP